MQSRYSNIVKFFVGFDLTYQDEAKQFLNHKLNLLTRKQLITVFFDGDNSYVNGQPLKGYLTLGMSTLFRCIKATYRFPTDITDQNAKQKLLEFLLGPGNQDVKSLKYKVLEELFFYFNFERLPTGEIYSQYLCQATTDFQASNLIHMTIELLSPKNSLELAKLYR